MERIIKLIGITGFLVIAISCFANSKNVQEELKVATLIGNNGVSNVTSGKTEQMQLLI